MTDDRRTEALSVHMGRDLLLVVLAVCALLLTVALVASHAAEHWADTDAGDAQRRAAAGIPVQPVMTQYVPPAVADLQRAIAAAIFLQQPAPVIDPPLLQP